MDSGDKILMAAGVTAAVMVGAFVLWGPSGESSSKYSIQFNFLKITITLPLLPGSSRLRQRRGQIAGLHNFGKTCFLNTLLQALAAVNNSLPSRPKTDHKILSVPSIHRLAATEPGRGQEESNALVTQHTGG